LTLLEAKMSETTTIAFELKRIAAALETLSRAGEPEEPNLVRPIGEFGGFDWAGIGASVVQSDRDGPTHLEHGGYLWTRRSPSNKFDPAIWFSRPAGKDDAGEIRYLRLITFRKIGEADPLPDAVKPVGNGQPAASQPAASQPAGRPYSPDRLRARLNELQAVYIGKAAEPAQRAIVGLLLDRGIPEKGRAARSFLFGVPEIGDVLDGLILAALAWLKPFQDTGGEYHADSMATSEMALLAASL